MLGLGSCNAAYNSELNTDSYHVLNSVAYYVHI